MFEFVHAQVCVVFIISIPMYLNRGSVCVAQTVIVIVCVRDCVYIYVFVCKHISRVPDQNGVSEA